MKEGSVRYLYALVGVVGIAVYLTTHCIFLSQVPGIHFDEAWAANFSAQLSLQQLGRNHLMPGFTFPLEAMSPYTAPWSHWVSALFFKIFSISLFSDRLSGVFLTAAGIGMISAALYLEKQRKAACLLPWICAFFLPLVLNHRFCIELTTFHVFCFGLLFFGLVRKVYFLIWAGIFFGTTSHILFLAPSLATWITRRLQMEPLKSKERILIGLTSLSLFPFLIRIFFEIPDREKSIALLVLNLGILIDTVFPILGNSIGALPKKVFLALGSTLSIPAFLFLLFFSEGHWNILFNYGWIAEPRLIGLSWVILIGASVFRSVGFYRVNRRLPWPKSYLIWLIFFLVVTLAISTKPTSRYYEIGFLALAIAASLSLSEFKLKNLFPILFLFSLSSSSQLWVNYFQVGLQHLGKESYFSFFIPRDNSSDFIPKQDLVQFLGAQGCGFGDVESQDTRLFESLRFLSYGDWPVVHAASGEGCRFGKVLVSRKSQLSTPKEGTQRIQELGPFVIDQL